MQNARLITNWAYWAEIDYTKGTTMARSVQTARYLPIHYRQLLRKWRFKHNAVSWYYSYALQYLGWCHVAQINSNRKLENYRSINQPVNHRLYICTATELIHYCNCKWHSTCQHGPIFNKNSSTNINIDIWINNHSPLKQSPIYT